jgi:L-phenylalanine/L-methionine N-acetyltransferase
MLRLITIADFDFIYQLYMHPQVNPYLLYEPMDAAAFKPVFTDLLQQQIVFVFEQDAKPVGMCKLVPETHRSSHVIYLGGFAAHPDIATKGTGTKILQAVIEYAKQNGFLRIVLSVLVSNAKAIALYKKCGFVIEGTLKNYTYSKSLNVFSDEYLMAYLLPLPKS